MLTVSFNNTNFTLPEEGEQNWSYLTNYLSDLALYLTNGYLANSQASVKLSPVTTSGIINDLATSNKSLFDLSQASKLTGLANPSQGRFVTILNTSSNVLEITHNDSSSTDTNRIVTDDNQSYFLNPSNFITLYYDQNLNRWRLIRESVLDKSVIKSVSTVGAIDNYEVSNNCILLFSGATSISGFVARPGRQLILVNTTGSAITIKDQATSSASNQIITGKSGDITLDNNTSISLAYDSINSKWRVVGSNIARSEINTIISDVALKEVASNKGIANGYAPLNASTKLANSYIDLAFKNLNDVPSSYTSQKGKVVKVKTDESGLEFGNSVDASNYITYSTAIDTPSSIGYNTYADTASTSPIDGTGGTANITFNRNTSSPISSDADFRLVKDASNRQGQGVSYDFTIDKRHNAKVLQITLDTSLISGTYATGDLKLFIIDTVSGEVIQPVNYSIELPVVGLSTKLIATFQTHVTNVSYRLCIHVSSTSASAYTVAFNNFKVWETEKNFGAIITDWTTYTPTSPNSAYTITSSELFFRRVGSNLEIKGEIVFNTTSSVEFRLPLPNSYTITSDYTSSKAVGTANGWYSDTSYKEFTFKANGGNNYLTLGVKGESGGSGNITSNVNANDYPISSDKVTIEISVPIAGWGSSVALSSDSGDSRVVYAKYKGFIGGVSVSTSAPFRWDTKIADTHNSVTTGSGWKFTAPVSGYYKIFGTASITSDGNFYLYKNGVLDSFLIAHYNSVGGGYQFNASAPMNVGDYIDIRTSTSNTSSSNSNLADATVTIERIGSSSQLIATSESVIATATKESGSWTDNTIVTWTHKQVDTHNTLDISTGEYTCPTAGRYLVIASLRPSSYYTGSGSTASSGIQIRKNGIIEVSVGNYWNGSSSIFQNGETGGKIVNCLAGDKISIFGIGTWSVEAGKFSQLSITRVGI